jgi:hypothetical protein
MSIKLMSAVWERSDISSTQKLVLLALADWANDDGLCWPSIDRLAQKTGMAGRSVQRIIRDLEQIGLVKRDEVAGKGNRYWVLTPLTDCHPRHSVTPPLTECHPTPDTVSPNTPYTPHLPVNVIRGLPDWLPLDAWDGWLEMRRAKKKPMTGRAMHRALNKLEAMREAGQDIAEVLDRSTMNGWTDVYEIKGVNKNGNRKADGVDAALDSLFEFGGTSRQADGQSVARIGGPAE